MNSSTEKYQNLVKAIDGYVRAVALPEATQAKFQELAKSSDAIIVTGTGTSLPTAQYLAARLQHDYPNKPIRFLPTAKAIREVEHLTANSLFVVISYGLNRADSLILLEKATRRCRTVAISGNNNPMFQVDLNIVIPPEEEKIFCRPVSPLTTLMAIGQLLGDEVAPIADIAGIDEIANSLNPDKQTIILYTADVSYAAELWGITLREGAGMNVSVKDMENYSHGYYGPDTKQLDERQYIILNSDSSEDQRDFDRAKGLYEITCFTKYVVTAHGNQFAANASLFRMIPEIILRLLLRTGYDMYAPNGMEENRKYHEYEHYRDY